MPDWLQVDFAGSKTIDEISVFGLHDNYTVENTPTETQTFTLYGLIAFTVQYWNGSAWTTIPNGNVTGDIKVWRKFTFSPITTSKIRVTINQVPDSWSRVVEIQAFETSASGEKVQWLVPDHLGTPRIVLDQTGSLANVKRHDYLPFGEELIAGTGGRTVGQGYAGDGVRQQFTSKERDVETGLDYFLARYYSSTQGRFASTDPILMKQDRLRDPQELNLYAYVRNNPLKYIDPDGEDITVSRTQQYEFIVERRAEDNPELLKQVRVSVTEVVTERYSDDGKLLGTTTQATATAENTQEANLRLSQNQLDTVGRVAAAVIEEASGRGVAREVALGIAAKETFLGADPRPGARDFQQPAVNPMQLSMNRANTDLRHNIRGALDVYTERSTNRTLEEGLQRYGPGRGNPGGANYAQTVIPYINRIRDAINGTIRQTSPRPTVRYVY